MAAVRESYRPMIGCLYTYLKWLLLDLLAIFPGPGVTVQSSASLLLTPALRKRHNNMLFRRSVTVDMLLLLLLLLLPTSPSPIFTDTEKNCTRCCACNLCPLLPKVDGQAPMVVGGVYVQRQPV